MGGLCDALCGFCFGVWGIECVMCGSAICGWEVFSVPCDCATLSCHLPRLVECASATPHGRLSCLTTFWIECLLRWGPGFEQATPLFFQELHVFPGRYIFASQGTVVGEKYGRWSGQDKVPLSWTWYSCAAISRRFHVKIYSPSRDSSGLN